MSNQDAVLPIPASRFNDFSVAISMFNKRTDEVNAKLKKAKYQKVSRFPNSTNVKTGMVSVTVAIKDRSKVLWQELSEILDLFKATAKVKRVPIPPVQDLQPPTKADSKPVEAPSRQWGIWVPCESEEAARAASGFLQAIAKVGKPQVECRG